MRTIIIDDEPLLLEELSNMLSCYPQIEVVDVYTDPFQALRELEDTKPELAVLDIEMRGLNGIELAKNLRSVLPGIEMLFVTAYNHYATEAFDVSAVDYILKPVRPERLQKALNRLWQKRSKKLTEPIDLRIQSFDKFGVYIDGKAVKWSRAKQRELLAYLLQNQGQWIDKYKICDDLWRDCLPEQALSNLQTAVWAIRKLFKDTGVTRVSIDYASNSYILNLKNVNWDVKQYDMAYKRFMNDGSIQSGKEAMRIYHDGYLLYEDWLWAIIERERYALLQDTLMKAIQKSSHKLSDIRQPF